MMNGLNLVQKRVECYINPKDSVFAQITNYAEINQIQDNYV